MQEIYIEDVENYNPKKFSKNDEKTLDVILQERLDELSKTEEIKYWLFVDPVFQFNDEADEERVFDSVVHLRNDSSFSFDVKNMNEIRGKITGDNTVIVGLRELTTLKKLSILNEWIKGNAVVHLECVDSLFWLVTKNENNLDTHV